eukprot:Rhum_TRINITY_DN2533_c0_g1::Rhum_TRINITY_DN2533_c0_g1_i1::g.7470::m.7470/K05543/DUS2; tRNA-dihydrouridine synthase 2
MCGETAAPVAKDVSLPVEKVGPYSNKVVLAPMVRVTALPFRLMCAKHGAGVVFSEELVAQKLMKTQRRVNEQNGTIEYVLVEQHGKAKKQQLLETLIFSTLIRKEKGTYAEGVPVVLQLGSSDPAAAAKAAKHVEQDVDGIDLNMGCPKAFSIKGGMGAALLSTPELACSILKSLADSVQVPVTVKMRMLEDKQEMVDLLKGVAKTGVKQVTIHARFKHHRYTQDPLIDHLKGILELLGDYPLPIVYNGNVWAADGAFKLGGAEVVGAGKGGGVMIARGALLNPSCFAQKPLSKVAAFTDLMHFYLKYKGGMRNVKYTLTRSFQEIAQYKKEFDAFHNGKNMYDFWVGLNNDPNDPEFAKLYETYEEPVHIVPGFVDQEGNINYLSEEEEEDEDEAINAWLNDEAPPAKRAKVE